MTREIKQRRSEKLTNLPDPLTHSSVQRFVLSVEMGSLLMRHALQQVSALKLTAYKESRGN